MAKVQLGDWVPPVLVRYAKDYERIMAQSAALTSSDHDLRDAIQRLAQAYGQLDDPSFENITRHEKRFKSLNETLWESLRLHTITRFRLGLQAGMLSEHIANDVELIDPNRFAKSMRSAVDWGRSKVIRVPRDSDAAAIEVRVVMANASQTLSDHANSVARVVRAAATKFFDRGHLVSQAAEMTHLRINESSWNASAANIVATFVVVAAVAHRNVRQFDNLLVRADVLLEGWNYYHPRLAVPNPAVDPVGFLGATLAEIDAIARRNNPNVLHPSADLRRETLRRRAHVGDPWNYQTSASKAYIIDEVQLGSIFVGLLHIVDDQAVIQNGDGDDGDAESAAPWSNGQGGTKSSSTFGTVGGSMDGTMSQREQSFLRLTAELAAMSGTASLTTDYAKALIREAVNARYRLNFDIIAIGAKPRFSDATMRYAINQFAAYDPDRFVATFVSEDRAAEQVAASKKQANMASVIHAVVKALNDAAASAPELSTQSFLHALEDFITDPGDGGEVVGFSVRPFTRIDVIRNSGARVMFPEWESSMFAAVNLLPTASAMVWRNDVEAVFNKTCAAARYRSHELCSITPSP